MDLNDVDTPEGFKGWVADHFTKKETSVDDAFADAFGPGLNLQTDINDVDTPEGFEQWMTDQFSKPETSLGSVLDDANLSGDAAAVIE